MKNSKSFIGRNMNKKIHLGFYMFTPMIGGAEKLLRDLLFGIDRQQFKVSLFYESWPEFDAFLNLSLCPEINVCPVPILEPCGHISIASISKPTPPSRFATIHDMVVKIIVFIKQIHKKYNPIRKQTGRIFNILADYLCAGPNIFYLYKAFKKQKLDVLHIINGGYPGAASAREAVLAAKFANIPVCIMTVCNSPAKRKFPKFIERKIDDLVYKYVDKFVVPAKPVAQLLTELRGFGASKICIIPWGVPMPKSFLTNSAISDLCQSLKIPKKVKIIGNIARFVPRKGHFWLIQAISILAKKISNFHVVLVGDGPFKKEIENQVKSLGLEKLITFTGYRPDTYEMTQMFDIFVYPSILEGLPISLLEAMSLSKPIVATCVDGISEAIVNNKTGIIVPPRDSLILAKAIEQLLINPKFAEDMGKASFVRFKAKYTLKHMIKQNGILYQNLLK